MFKSPDFEHLEQPAIEQYAYTFLDSYSDTFTQYLSERHYATRTIESYVNSVAHFTHWLTEQRLALADINEALIIRFYDQHLPDCQCTLRFEHSLKMTRAALKHFLTILRENEQCPPKRTPNTDAIAVELEAFDCFLTNVRGLSPTTCAVRIRHVHDFLRACVDPGPLYPSTIEPADVIRFMTHYTAAWVPASIRAASASLRSYFAFRAIKAEQTAALSAALPRVAQWRLAGLPQQLSEVEIQQLLGAFDRHTATGKRDYAMTRCLLDLGLRRSEVAHLQLDDVDWRSGILTIRSKGKRLDVLPLPQTTGRAIAQYLQDGRPRTTRREVFVRHRPPINASAGPDIVRNAVRYAAKRCGLQDRIRGTHILRHTLAGRLVQRGAPFKEIADLLRHRSLDTTTIYAKVDLQTLSSVALPWPGSQT